MSTEGYKVWCVELGETEEDARYIIAYDGEEAARKVAEKSYHEEAYDSAFEAHVRGPYGELQVFEIYAVPTVCFRSMEVTP